MNRFEEFKLVLASDEIKKYGKDILEYSIKALLGDVEALVMLTTQTLTAPGLYKNVAFVEKLKMFLNGVILNEEDYKDLTETIVNGDQNENAERILDCLDSIETTCKVKYIINATRSNIKWNRGMGGLNKREYFRTLYILKNILLEDIEFLTESLSLKEIPVNDTCRALSNLGLMYATTLEDDRKYAFSPLAYRFYAEVIRYDDETIPEISRPNEFPEEFQIPSNVVEFGNSN